MAKLRPLQALADLVPYGRGDLIISLFKSGEEHLALETLLSNLYEFDISIPPSQAAWLQETASLHGMSPATMHKLHPGLPLKR